MNSYDFELNKLKSFSQFRKISDIESKSSKYIEISGKKLLNFSSNNYLNIADNFEIYQLFETYLKNNLDAFSFGSASSRLLTGNLPVYKDLENLISKMYKKDSCLLFNSGYHANIGVISSIAGKKDIIFSDKLNHASIIDGMKLSDAEFIRYKHADYQDLEDKLQKNRDKYENAIIVSESVFSMDGDICDLDKLVQLKKDYNCILVIDEAHAFGLFGNTALGIAENTGLIDKIDIIIATFGKSVGSIGAFVVANHTMIDYLINKSRSFIFSTVLPPINMLWTKFVIESIFPTLKAEREHLQNISTLLKSKLTEYEIKTAGNSQIVPVIVGNNDTTVQLAEIMSNLGYLTLPIRPPTVPINSSRLRLSLTSDMTNDDIQCVAKAIRDSLCLLNK